MTNPALESDCRRILMTLQIFTNNELSEIMDNEEKISSLVSDLDKSFLQNLENEKQDLLTSINQIGESNLIKEPLLEDARAQVVLLSQEGEEISKSVEESYKTLCEKNGDMNLETALALLQTAASEMEEESDQIAQNFLNNEKDLDTFLEEFLNKRKVMHLRLVKAEKMTKLITQDSMLGGNYMNAPPLNINSQYFPVMPNLTPNVAPYPTSGNFNMPVPGGLYFQNHY